MPVGFMGYQVTEKVMHTSEKTAGMERGQSRDAQGVRMHREQYRSIVPVSSGEIMDVCLF